MQDAKGTKCAKGVITIEDDETVKMMNKIGHEGSAIENILGDDEREKREVIENILRDDEPEKKRCKRLKRCGKDGKGEKDGKDGKG